MAADGTDADDTDAAVEVRLKLYRIFVGYTQKRNMWYCNHFEDHKLRLKNIFLATNRKKKKKNEKLNLTLKTEYL